MYKPDEGQNISSIIELWSVFKANNTDNRTDKLPMMDSIAWPIGIQGLAKEQSLGCINLSGRRRGFHAT